MSPVSGVPAVVERVRSWIVRRWLTAALLWGTAGVVSVLLVAWLLAGEEGWLGPTAVPLLLDVSLLAAFLAGAGWMARSLPGIVSDARVAGAIESSVGLSEGRVRGALELATAAPPGVSRSLAGRAHREVLAEIEGADSELAGDLGRATAGWRRRGVGALALLLPFVVLAGVADPTRSAGAWRGLTTPVALLRGPALPPLEVDPGDVTVPRGDDVRIEVAAPSRDSVALEWRTVGDVPRSGWAGVVDGRTAFTLSDVRARTTYRVRAPDGAATSRYTVTPVDPLVVTDVTVSVTFPPHTGRPAEEHRGDVPPLTLPAGSSLSFAGRTSRPATGASLLGPGGRAAVTFEVDGASFTGVWTPAEGGVFGWELVDGEGRPAAVVPPPLEFTVVADSAPEVAFTFPARDTVLPLDHRQPLGIRARDDHGLAELELVAYRVTALGERGEPVTQTLGAGGRRAVVARPVMELSEWRLLPGDVVRYFARVRDNAPSPHAAETREYALRVPGAAEMRRRAEVSLDDAAGRLEAMAEEATRAAAETRELERRATAEGGADGEALRREERRDGEGGDPIGFERREALRRALERQDDLDADVDSLRRELADLGRAMEEAGLSEAGLREDLAELQEILESLVPEEETARRRREAEEADQMDVRSARESLESLLEDQEAFRERVERSLERFRRAAVEQDFRATTAEAEELAREEEALADAFEEGDRTELRTDQQERLGERAEGIEVGMEELERRLQELGENDAARGVREARSDAVEARERMREAAERARAGEELGASERARRAAEEMRDAAAELSGAQERMGDRRAAAVEEALRRTADEALSLARRQTDIREEMRGRGRDGLAELRADVAALGRGVRSMAEGLERVAGGEGGGSRELSERMGGAMQALGETVRAMEQGSGPTVPARRAAERAVSALNGVALQAMAEAGEMARAGQARAGGEQLQEQLEDLAQQQGELNNQTGQMMPMQLGRQAMQSQMQRIAQGQQSVAGELGDLADEPGRQEQALGDLDALAEEAREIAEELAGGRLDARTRERQERLFHRLLDAGRSLQKEELSEERESERPAVFERGTVLPLGEDALGLSPFGFPDAAALARLSPSERRLVLEYFDRLNRGRSGGGSR